jgi:hypothetical protein
MPRHREEVLNTILAEVIVARGMNADPETIRRSGAHRPDVYVAFRGMRLGLEGKVGDVANARSLVVADSVNRVDAGLTQMSIAVVYPESLRTAAFEQLAHEMSHANFDFCICTETGVGEWRNGSIDTILTELRRAHDALATDDIVRQAAESLSVYLQDVATVFQESPATCDRLVDLLGIGTSD